MDATHEVSAAGAAKPPAWQEALLRAGRKGARAVGELVLPPSLVVWRQPRSRARERKQVALTFDDGPAALTPDYLSVLAQHDARATFFVIGAACARHPELVQAIADAGHELAGHGYTHRRFTDLSPEALRAELLETQRLLPKGSGRRRLVRPPHGAASIGSTLTSARAGFTTVLWSHNSGDWATVRADEVTRTFAESSPPAGSIVLFHEGQRWTLDALPQILSNLREAGHELVTIGELLGR
jgi:peptidoglycan/xylan/chitin deacetylase (PgdA/CDA1 family)